MNKKIFLLGSERSGSNLLRTLLGNHSEISAPIAPHFCDVFYDQFKHYLPLNNDRVTELLQDVQTYINHPFNDWQLTFDASHHERISSFIDVVDLAYSEKAKQESKSSYFVKDNNNHRYALGILKEIPDAQFIYLYRDVRDQVASWLRTPLNTLTAYKSVTKWVGDQNECLSLNRFYNVPMHFVSYEELVGDPAGTMTKTLQFLDLEVEEGCFSTNKDNKEAEKIILWNNINKPIKKNSGKYRDILTKSEIEMVETIARSTMKELGYTPETNCDWEMGNKYVFLLKDKLRASKGEKKKKKLLEKEAKILKEKNHLVRELFSKFD